MAKITQSELNTLAVQIAKSSGSRFSVALNKLRKEAEAKGFDTPSNKSLASAMDFALDKALSSMAEGDARGIVSQSASVKAGKGDYRVHHNVVTDVGNAQAHAIAAYELNRYVNGIKREGKNSLSTVVRAKVIALFSALVPESLAKLDLPTVQLGKRFVANAETVETEAMAHYETELAKKRAKAEKADALEQARIDAAAKSQLAAMQGGQKRKAASVKEIINAAKADAKAEAVQV